MGLFESGAAMWRFYESAYGTEEARDTCNRYLDLNRNVTADSVRSFCRDLDAAMNPVPANPIKTIKKLEVNTMKNAEIRTVKNWIKDTAAQNGHKFYVSYMKLVNCRHNGDSPSSAQFIDLKTGRVYECTDLGITEQYRMVRYTHNGKTYIAGYGNTLLDLKRLEANIPADHRPIESVEVLRMISGKWVSLGHCEQRINAA